MTGTRLSLGLMAVGATAALVTALTASSQAAPSPDAAIVYAAGSGRNAEIYVLEQGGAKRRLTRNRVHEGFPTWSPDRTRVAFVRGEANADIYVMKADGTGVRRLTRAKGHDLYPAWSPDGKRIAFASNRAGAEPEIYDMRADGKNVRRLTNTPIWAEDTQPRFSPDGRYIVFTSNRVAFANYEIFRMRASDGRGLRRLTFWGTGDPHRPGDDLSASYSPDGTRIAFISERGGGYAVWSMNANGGDLRRIIRHRGLNHVFPRYSPDGTRLLYMTFAPNRNLEDSTLRTVAVDGSGDVVLAPGREPDW